MPDPDMLDFIASIFASLMAFLSACAWPVAIVVLIWMLRKPILAALPSLTRFKAAGFEIEFGDRVQELERRADKAAIPSVAHALEDVMAPDVARLFAFAEVNSRLAILEAWLLVESSIIYAATRLGIEAPSVHSRSLYYLLGQLPVDYAFSQELFSIVNELHELRNKAVHEVDFSLGMKRTLDYINLSIRVSSALRHLPAPGD
jgi:hypothetical protein